MNGQEFSGTGHKLDRPPFEKTNPMQETTP